MSDPAPPAPDPFDAPPDRGSLGMGIVVALIAGLIGHLLICLGYLAVMPRSGDEGFLILVLAMNPGFTQLVSAPFVGFALRKRARTLQGFLITLGVVFLLNAACWGVLTVAG